MICDHMRLSLSVIYYPQRPEKRSKFTILVLYSHFLGQLDLFTFITMNGNYANEMT